MARLTNEVLLEENRRLRGRIVDAEKTIARLKADLAKCAFAYGWEGEEILRCGDTVMCVDVVRDDDDVFEGELYVIDEIAFGQISLVGTEGRFRKAERFRLISTEHREVGEYWEGPA